jgi:hypothetical protein
MGLPDFQRVAEMYLSRGRGVEGPVFDLHNVYRYTHGHPEMGTDWSAQLHKSLFDVTEVKRLLRDAGYPSYVIFRYVFPEDPPELNLTLGFYATPARRSAPELESAARTFLGQFHCRFLDIDTLTFDVQYSVPESAARVSSSPPMQALRGIAYRAACRLAAMS